MVGNQITLAVTAIHRMISIHKCNMHNYLISGGMILMQKLYVDNWDTPVELLINIVTLGKVSARFG